MASIFGEGGSKHPLRTLDGCADLLGGDEARFWVFRGGVQRTLRTHVPTYDFLCSKCQSTSFRMILNCCLYVILKGLNLIYMMKRYYYRSIYQPKFTHKGKKWQQKASILLIVDGHSVTHIKWVKVWQEIVDGTKTSHSKDIASEDLTVVCHHKMCSPVSYPKGDESSL